MENFEQTNPTSWSQIPKLRVFQLIQKKFATVGISPNLVTQSYPLNGKVILGILLLTISFSCNLMFFFYKAKTFAEYTESMHMSSMAALISLIFVIVLLNVRKLFDLINDCENVANSSELKIDILNSKLQCFN